MNINVKGLWGEYHKSISGFDAKRDLDKTEPRTKIDLTCCVLILSFNLACDQSTTGGHGLADFSIVNSYVVLHREELTCYFGRNS